jgi:uncharacterized protein
MPIRKCVVCSAMKGKDELLRLTIEAGGRIIWERQGNPRGKGLYLCSKGDCIARFVVEKRYRKRFRERMRSEDLSSLEHISDGSLHV